MIAKELIDRLFDVKRDCDSLLEVTRHLPALDAVTAAIEQCREEIEQCREEIERRIGECTMLPPEYWAPAPEYQRYLQ